MRVLIVHIGTTSSGAPRRREQRLDVDTLQIGRAPDNDLMLQGLSVSIHHATISRGQAAPLLESVGSAELRLNGHLGTGGRLQSGDVIRIGRSELRVCEPGPDEDLALELELKDLRADGSAEPLDRTKLGIESGIVSRRKLAWLAIVAVLATFVGAPFGLGRLNSSWSSGEIASKHAAIANDCEKCHEVAFQRVADSACAACHADIGGHIAAEQPSRDLDALRCADCHKDHNGDTQLISFDPLLCEGCHRDIGERVPGTELESVSDFGTDHPTFRFDLVTRPGSGERTRVRAGPDLEERSGIHFNHLRHVGQQTNLPDGRRGGQDCGQCHQPDISGRRMLPVSFEKNCQGCHPLSFDAAIPNVEALHGDPAKMRAGLRALYAERVLSGRVSDEQAPDTVRFMRPGKTLSQRDSDVVSAWIETRLALAEDHLMKLPGECARCHTIVEGSASDGGTGIGPIELATAWLPRAKFSHATHGQSQCRECHVAAAVYDPGDAPHSERPAWSVRDAHPYGLLTPAQLETDETAKLAGLASNQMRGSERSADVLIPDRDQCRACHLGMEANLPAVPSACILCHSFHRPEHGPLHSPQSTRYSPMSTPSQPKAVVEMNSNPGTDTLRQNGAPGSLTAVSGSHGAPLPSTHRRVASHGPAPRG